MNKTDDRKELVKISHLMLVLSETIFSVLLLVEASLLGWEVWVLPWIVMGVIISWYLHISDRFDPDFRLWVYTSFLTFSFLYYGIHSTSFYDTTAIVVLFIILYSVTEQPVFITICQVLYVFVIAFDLVMMLMNGESLDTLGFTRIFLHLLIIFMAGYISKLIIRKRHSEREKSREEIAELKKVTLQVDDFLTNVSHEIRTPINVVTGLTGVLLSSETDESRRRDLISVQKAGNRAAEQIRDILDYTEIDMDKLTVTREEYKISSLISDLIEELSLLATTQIELVFDIDTRMPAVLTGDADKVKKILRHLIVNGFKFTKKGGIFVKIFTLEREYGVNLCLQVTDTGIGMSEEEVDRIFEQFYQSSSGQSRTAGGFGLGMTIVHGLVVAMGGFVKIDSEPDFGTTVTVSIPQKIADPSPCMALNDKDSICLGGFMSFANASVPRIREFYASMISKMEADLGITIHRSDTLEGLKKLITTYELTHLIVGESEYYSNSDYIDMLSSEMDVIVLAGNDVNLGAGSKAVIMKKPFYGFPLIELLNEGRKGPAHEGSQKTGLDLRGYNALVVDDEPMNLIVAKGIFSGYGMEITTAGSGQEAIDLCLKYYFDLVFMDHMMPGMDGVEAMKRIKANSEQKGEETRFIALTANAISGAKDMFMTEGFDGFIPKPIVIPEMERVLKRVTRRMDKKKALPKDTQKEEESLQGLLQEEPDVLFEEPDELFEEPSEEPFEEPSEEQPGDTSQKKSGKTEEELYQILEDGGVVTAEGLVFSNGDWDFYISLLKEYRDSSADKESQLQVDYEAKDWNSYSILIHSIKSTSRLIGASRLGDKAEALEMAAKKGDEAFICKKHTPFMKMYASLRDTLTKALE